MGKRNKIEAGDWVRLPNGIVGQVRVSCGIWFVSTGDKARWNPEGAVKVPASLPDMMKSHRLLLRWWEAENLDQTYQASESMKRHCRRLTAKGARK